MGFFKKIKMKINGKWYPKSVLVGKPVTTEQIAKRVATESTVAPADVAAVLTALGPVMADYMSQGRSGVATEKEVTVNQITGVRVRFIPETRYRREGGGGRVATRGLSDVVIDWEEWKGEEKKPAQPGNP